MITLVLCGFDATAAERLRVSISAIFRKRLSTPLQRKVRIGIGGNDFRDLVDRTAKLILFIAEDTSHFEQLTQILCEVPLVAESEPAITMQSVVIEKSVEL